MATVEELLLNINTEGGPSASNAIRNLESAIRSLINPIQLLENALRQSTDYFNRFQNEINQSDSGFNRFESETRQSAETIRLLETQLRELTLQFNNLQGEQRQSDTTTAQLEAQIRELTEQLQRLERETRQTDEEMRRMDRSTREAEQGFGLLHRMGANLKQTLMSIVSTAGGMLVYGAITNIFYQLADAFKQGITDGIKYNIEMENNMASFTTMLGSADKAKKLMDQITKMAAATPFETKDLTSATTMLMSYGFTQEKVIPIMSKLGDVSLGNNEKFQSLSRTMGQINALGKLQGGDLNQLIGQGWNPLNEITKKTGETMEQVKDRMSKGKVTYKEVEDALTSVTSAGGMFYKSMDTASKTFEGTLSTLKDKFSIFLGQATKPLFNYLKDVGIPAISDLIDSFSNMGKILKDKIPPIINTFKTKWVELFGTDDDKKSFKESIDDFNKKLPDALDKVNKKVEGVFNKLIQLRDTWRSITSGNMGTLIDLFPASWQGNIALGIQKFNEVRSAISGIISFLQTSFAPVIEVFKNTFKNMDWGPAQEAVSKLGNTIINVLIPAIKPLAEVVGGVLVGAFALLLGHINGVLTILPSIISTVASIWNTILGFVTIIVGVFTNNEKAIKDGWDSMWSGIVGTVTGMVAIIQGYIKGFNDAIVGFFKGLSNTLVGHSIVPEMCNAITGVFQGLWNSITGIVSGIYNTVVGWFNNARNTAVSIWQGLVNNVGSIVSGLWSTVSNAFQNVVTAISNKASAAYDAASRVATSIKNAISDMATSMYNAGANLVQSVINGIGSMIGKVKNAAGNVAQAIKNFFPSSPAKEGPLQSIPKWMPTMIGTMTDDLYAGVDKIRRASSNLATNIKSELYLQPAAVSSNSYSRVDQNVSIVVNAAHLAADQVGEQLVNTLLRYGIKVNKG
jgi:tape measure domain-containing protein